MPNEKLVLTVRELHLGFIKETFRAGAVIEHDEASGRLIIDGRRFDDTRDLDLLKKHGWVAPYTPEAVEAAKLAYAPAAAKSRKPRPGENMEIVQSDADEHETIDITDTQVSKRNQEVKADARDAAKQREKDRKMEIIRGDETVEERIAGLKGKNDASSIAERVRLLRQPAELPVVHDDSLGSSVGSKTPAMNAGQPLPSREEVEAKTASARAVADARKKEAERARRASGVEVPSENAAPPAESGDVKTAPKVVTVTDQFQTPLDHARDVVQEAVEGAQKAPGGSGEGLGVSEAAAEAAMAENAELRAENKALKAKAAILSRLEALEKGGQVKRTPVTDPQRAEEVLADKGV